MLRAEDREACSLLCHCTISLSHFVSLVSHTYTPSHIAPAFSHAAVNTIEWQWETFCKRAMLLRTGRAIGQVTITTTPRGSCDSWTLDANKDLGGTQPLSPRERLAPGSPVSRGMYCLVEPCPGPCTVPLTPSLGAHQVDHHHAMCSRCSHKYKPGHPPAPAPAASLGFAPVTGSSPLPGLNGGH